MIFIISFILAIGFTLIFQKKMIKNPGVFYIIFLLIGTAIPVIHIAGFNFTGFFGEYIYPIFDKSALGTAFFVLVMFTGAFPGKSSARKTFLPIRRQLSIIACILTFGHNIAYGKTYFVMLFLSPASLPWYQLAAAICSLVMVLILIPLFVTSFIKVRRKMKPGNWKKLQRLAYVFYGLLYIHIILLNGRGLMLGILRNKINCLVYTVVFAGYLVLRLMKYTADKNKKSISNNILIKTSIVTGLTAGALVLGLGTLLSIVPEEESTAVTGKYADGIYTGTAFGYTDNISVTIVIENSQVSDIYFENYNDDEEYKSYGDYMLQKIMESPYGEVDTISGATFSTGAVKKAYEKALSKASADFE